MLRLIFLLLWVPCLLNAQKKLVNAQLLDSEGNPKQVIGSLTKPTIVSFWASWCKPCLEEIAAIDKMIKEKALEINFVLINTDEVRSQSRAKVIAKQKKWSAELLFDTNQDYMRQLGIRNLPQTFIYDKDQNLVAAYNAYVKGDEWKYYEYLK